METKAREVRMVKTERRRRYMKREKDREIEIKSEEKKGKWYDNHKENSKRIGDMG